MRPSIINIDPFFEQEYWVIADALFESCGWTLTIICEIVKGFRVLKEYFVVLLINFLDVGDVYKLQSKNEFFCFPRRKQIPKVSISNRKV